MNTIAAPAEVEVHEPTSEEETEHERPWVVIVWNDPINLMSYVTLVFQKLFGYSLEKATRLMLQVHHEGKAVVSSGNREKSEHDVARLHAHGLWATMQRDQVFLPRKFKRDPAGGVRLRFDEGEVLLLRDLLAELEALLEDPDDPAVRRLFPPAHDDRERDEQYRSLVRDQLVGGRAKALAAMRDTLGSETLSPDEADAWLRALNDLRLVLGTRLDVTEDIDFEALDPRDPRGRDLAVYAYLSWLQEELVESLGEG